MPLLNAIGVNACQWSFCIAFAFLSGEEEEDYNWALTQLRSIYVADAKDYKGQEKWKDFYSSWHDLVASSNEDIYYQKLSDFKKKYIPDYISQVGYITETWLDLYKEKFVKAWVDQHLHFNQYVTSRCEGIHQLIKSYLKTSQLNLFDAWRHIKLVVTNQVAELESNQARQQAGFPLKLSGSLYGNIRVAGPSTATAQSEVNELDYDDARAIYRRYKADREAWYATQPRGALKTNQQYRKAMKLPQRYTKAKYNWCLDYKEMGPQCRIGRSVRDWTKEEMMAYLDFDEAENERVNKQVEEELKARRFTTYRGPDYVWKAAARDYEDQQRIACGSSYLSVGATDAVEDDATGDVPPCVDGFADDTADDAAVSILTTMQLVSSLPDPACPDNPDDGSSSGSPSCKDDTDADTAAAGRASPDNAGESSALNKTSLTKTRQAKTSQAKTSQAKSS
ncbi:hypothetical protein ACKAV7_015021 [Fusarium commune]